MKHLLMNKEDGNGNAPAAPANDAMLKKLEESFAALRGDITNLNKKFEAANRPAEKPAKKVEEDEGELESLILIDPKKAVKKITSQVREDVLNTVNSASADQAEFQNKYSELSNDFPEILNANSEVYKRAKEIMDASSTKRFDANALERAVLRAAAESGVVASKHRKQPKEEDEGGEYLGGSGSSEPSRGSRKQRSDKLPAATVAFAQLMGLNTKDPKVIESLTKRQQERAGSWNRYK